MRIFADKNLVVGDIGDGIYGSFLEHLGRAIYKGIYEPSHPLADENGFRKDVLALVKELGVSLVRYPGGNFVSGYDWKDGIGPKEIRKARLELGWRSIETNEFGIDEFMKWCARAEVKPMLAFNMGTGTQMDALEYFEYCNHPSGTYYSDLRRKNASEEPYNVKFWCIGNEMDGSWQTCGTDADSYGKKAVQTARIIRCADCRSADDPESVKLVVCGSSKRTMPTFPDWDRTVLEYTYDEINYISMHTYYEYDPASPKPLEDFFCSADDMNEFICVVRSVINYVKEKKRSSHDVYISFDEWNVWNQTDLDVAPYWRVAPPLLEQVYTFRDVLVFGGMLNALLNNCDVVKVACLAQLVNVIAPIMTVEGGVCFRQGIFYPFAFASANGRGKTLKAIVECGKIEGSSRTANALNVCVTHNEEKKEVCLFVCNYSCNAEKASVELRSFGNLKCVEFKCMENSDLSAANTADNMFAIQPFDKALPQVSEGGNVNVEFGAYSWNYLKFTYERR